MRGIEPAEPTAEPVVAPADGLRLARTAIDTVLRVGLVAALALWCVWIAKPFILPCLWGAIIAVALDPLHVILTRRLGGRPSLSAGILAGTGILVMLGPLAGLGLAMVDTVRSVATAAIRGEIAVPPPPAALLTIPVVGATLDEYWRLAQTNLREVLGPIEPQIRAIAAWFLGFVGGLGLGFLSGLLAVIVAGFLLAWRERVVPAAHGVAVRLVGERGEELLNLCEDTVQAVAQGIVGTAFIQSMLITIGFLVIGVPGAAVWGFVAFLLGLVQIGVVPVVLPVVVWAFMNVDTGPAVAFAVWSALTGLVDNVLRPILIGRGGTVPLLVLLVGVIGGLLAHGLIGLFIGPVVVALGYTLLQAWLTARAREVV